MVKRWFAFVVATLLGSAVVAFVAGCQPEAGSNRKACDTQVSAPYLDTSLTPHMIVVKTVSACDVKPLSHVVHITIQRKGDNGVWGDERSSWQDDSSCRELPQPGYNAPCKYAVPCRKGTFRAKVLVTGTGPDGRTFSFALPEHPQAIILKC